MKKFHYPKANTIRMMELPLEIAYNQPIFTIIGHSMVSIENYKCILYYSENEICIKTTNGNVKIFGCHLNIPFYTSEEMKIEGQISSILLESR